jgi:hypothetical protein
VLEKGLAERREAPRRTAARLEHAERLPASAAVSHSRRFITGAAIPPSPPAQLPRCRDRLARVPAPARHRPAGVKPTRRSAPRQQDLCRANQVQQPQLGSGRGLSPAAGVPASGQHTSHFLYSGYRPTARARTGAELFLGE